MDNTISSLLDFLTALIPISTFIAVGVGVFLFARYKGTIDALKEAAATYKTLAESKDASLEEVYAKLEACEKEIKALKRDAAIQKEAVKIAVDEVLAGIARTGYCSKADTCPQFISKAVK